MIFKSLASSSAGNVYIVSDGDTHILLECGLSYNRLKKAVGFDLSSFSACLVSHEHKDHAKSAVELINRGMPVYMSYGTAIALDTDGAVLIKHLEQFNVGTLDIVPFDTFHDAQEPLGFCIKSRKDCEILVFAIDTVNIRYIFPGVNILAIEANYDKNILSQCTKMPDKVKYRIANAHMEIDTLCEYLRTLDLTMCKSIYLLHISDSTSREAQFINKVIASVPVGIDVTACEK